ncbi:hypothetical protein Hanom_Chr01g00039431 [Helianthus anomalus]
MNSLNFCANEEEPETEILIINSDDEGVEISCDDEDEAELPPKIEVSSVVQQPVITSKSLARQLKSITEKMGNPLSNPLVHVEDQMSSDPKDPDSLPLKRKRRDPRPGIYVEQSQDQPTNDNEDEDGLYNFDFEKNTTDTTTTAENIFEFDVDTQRMDVDTTTAEIPVTTTVSVPVIDPTPPVTTTIACSSGMIHEESCS